MSSKSGNFQRKLAAIFYADVAGYSRLTGLDEEGTHHQLRDYLALLAASIEDHRGRVVHYAGDAVLADFGTVLDALTCAADVQRELAASNSAHAEDRRVEFRIGINLGDVIVDREEIYGDGVNVAARLESLADPGGICVSESVRTAAGSKLPFGFEFMGEKAVKNIERPVRAYRVVTGDNGSTSPAVDEHTDQPSIVVLAFDNMSNDPEQEYFSDGISEDLITELSRISGLFVIARNSAFAYKGKQTDVRQIGRELGVRYVLEGSVRKAGNRVRITAQLVDGDSGGHVWADRYDRELDDIFEVQDQVTAEIFSALLPKLSAGEEGQQREQSPTDNLDAYDYFLRGRQQSLLDTAEDNAQARELLEKAVELDPGFSMAYALLARNNTIAYVNRWGPAPGELLDTACRLARRSIELDQDNPFAHFALGTAEIWNREFELSEREMRKSIGLDPNFADGYAALGMMMVYVGRPEEGVELLQKSMRLDPHYRDIFLHLLAMGYFHSGRYQDAVMTLRRRLIRKPESDISRVLLASAYGHLGEFERARAEWRELQRVNPDYSIEQRRGVLPYKDPADFEDIVAGLDRAGVLATA